MVLVTILPILIVAFIIAIARCITTIIVTVIVIVIVLFAFSIARRPLFIVLGTVSPPAVRTTAIFFFAIVLVTFLISRTVLLIRRR